LERAIRVLHSRMADVGRVPQILSGRESSLLCRLREAVTGHIQTFGER